MCYYRKGPKNIRLLVFWLTDCLKKYVVFCDAGVTKMIYWSQFKRNYVGFVPDYESEFDLHAGLAELSRFINENGPHGVLKDIIDPAKNHPWIYRPLLGDRKQQKKPLQKET